MCFAIEVEAGEEPLILDVIFRFISSDNKLFAELFSQLAGGAYQCF
jgi:hypothetical protein